MAKLSVVICVYNTNERYFDECLTSIFDSTLKDIEVIVVDDGSTKDYSKILKKFNKIKYFKRENGGTLSARIFGVSKATAPYVCFVDSDDSVSFNYFEANVTKIEDANADIVFNDWAFHTEQTKYYCKNDSTIKNDINFVDEVPLERFMLQEGKEHSYYVLWNKLFKKEILANACKEIEKLNTGRLVYAEDVLITYYAFSRAKKVVNTHLGYLFYRIHNNQQINADSKEKLKNHVKSMALVFDCMQADMESIGRFEELKGYFYKWKRLLCSTNYISAKKSGYRDLYPFIKEKYGVKKLLKMPIGYDNAYEKQRVLPQNIIEVDNELKKLYYSNKFAKIYAKRNSYARRTLLRMKRIFGKKYEVVNCKKHADIIMPKEFISFKQKLLHNFVAYKIGTVLFPKGSKIRKLIKSKL